MMTPKTAQEVASIIKGLWWIAMGILALFGACGLVALIWTVVDVIG